MRPYKTVLFAALTLALHTSFSQAQPTALLADTPGADIAPEAASPISDFRAFKSGAASDFMAVTANPHASNAALEVLQNGGSAVDAAIAAQMVLNVVEPQSSGIGGGAFLLHWDAANKSLTTWDGRETAPQALTSDHFMEDGEPMPFLDAVVGGHGVGVPGLLAMLEKAHGHFGKLPWADLFVPARELADGGFPISPRLHNSLKHTPRVAANPEIKAYFFEEDGSPKAVGTRLTNPDLAAVFEFVGRRGANAFYFGPLAEYIVDRVQNAPNGPGLLVKADLQTYEAKQRPPVCGKYKQYTICGAAPPSSGATTVIGILGVLDELEKRNPANASYPQHLHVFAEASRLAFADRAAYLADPDYVQVPTQGLVSPRYLQSRAKLISGKKRLPAAIAGLPRYDDEGPVLMRRPGIDLELPSTTHITVVDGDGNIVSMTSSIENAFGSRIWVDGFLLNNQLTDFSFVPFGENNVAVANRPAGGKRPRSSMSPIIVFEGNEPILALGSPGGARIINYVAETIWQILNFQRSPAHAVATPRIVDMGRQLELEEGAFDLSTIAYLKSMGHNVVEKPLTSGLHVISLERGSLYGGADPRREGSVAAGNWLPDAFEIPTQMIAAQEPEPAEELPVAAASSSALTTEAPETPPVPTEPKKDLKARILSALNNTTPDERAPSVQPPAEPVISTPVAPTVSSISAKANTGNMTAAAEAADARAAALAAQAPAQQPNIIEPPERKRSLVFMRGGVETTLNTAPEQKSEAISPQDTKAAKEPPSIAARAAEQSPVVSHSAAEEELIEAPVEPTEKPKKKGFGARLGSMFKLPALFKAKPTPVPVAEPTVTTTSTESPAAPAEQAKPEAIAEPPEPPAPSFEYAEPVDIGGSVPPPSSGSDTSAEFTSGQMVEVNGKMVPIESLPTAETLPAK